MANKIWHTGGDTSKTYEFSGFTSTINDSISSPGSGGWGVGWDGSNVIIGSGGSNKIHKMSNEFTSTVDSSFSFTSAGGENTWDGTNLIVNVNNTKVSRLTGFTSTVESSFSTSGTIDYLRGCDWHVGEGNLYVSGDVANDLFQMDGFSNTVLSSIASVGATPRGISTEFDAGGGETDTISVDQGTDDVHQLTNFTTTVAASFASPDTTGAAYTAVGKSFVAAFVPKVITF